MDDKELQKVISKMDAFLFHYTEEESRIEGYITGKSIVNQEERYVTSVAINPKEPELLEFVLNEPSSIEERTLVMDYRLLTDDVIEVLKRSYASGIISGIRILPEDYQLTKDVFEKLNQPEFYGFLVSVHSESDDIKNPSSYLDIRRQEGLCQIEHLVFNNGGEDHFNVHISKKLSREELHNLAKIIKEHNYQNIMVDFYEPSYYKTMLNALKEEGIPQTIQITFLANPLYDEVTCYDGLSDILENNIVIHYNTCNDLNQMTREEPHTEGARYYSDIEASGLTDSANYIEMVKMLEEVVSYMEEKQYSPLEKIAYLNDYFKKNFIYDPDYQTTDHAENANLDKVYRKDRMICEGFSNLYSAILRRAGLLCFTYGTDDHQKNIVRVVDEKYGTDAIAIIDPTFDLSADNNRNVFDNFLVPIDNDLYAHEIGLGDRVITTPEVINIPSSLSMASEYYHTYIDVSNPVYATDPLGYAIRMLQLMGLGSEEIIMSPQEAEEYYKSALARSNLTKKIPADVIAQAVHTVRTQEHEYGDEFESTHDLEEVTRALEQRGFTHETSPRIKLFNGLHVEVKPYEPSLEVDFVSTKPQPMIYKRPRKQKENETNEEFSRYLENFYDTMFYRRYEEKMDMRNPEQELEEFEIVEASKEEIPEIVIYRDMDDSSRTFVTEDVLRRFHIGEPEYSITLDQKTVVYEITDEEEAYIIGHANNKYAPYTIRFQNFDFNNEITDSMEHETKENQEAAPDEILIFRDVDHPERAFVTKPVLQRFNLEVPSEKVFLGHMMVYEIDAVQAINIISNCNNPYAPYMIRYVSIQFDSEVKKEEPKEEPKEEQIEEDNKDEIVIFRDVDNSGRTFVTKSVMDRFHLETPIEKVYIGRMIVYEINPSDAIDIINGCNNPEQPYSIRYIAIQFDPITSQRGEERPIPYDDELSTVEEDPFPYDDELSTVEEDPFPYDDELSTVEEDPFPYNDELSTVKEESREEVQDDNLIPGTHYKKPRVRRPYETDEHYVAYLEGYYDSIFGNEEDLFTPKQEDPKDDNLIPGTPYEKPRIRGNYETDEAYVDYLRDYYNSIFGTEHEDNIQTRKLIRPRARRESETEEDYMEYLAMFYGTPIETEERTTSRRK